MFKKFKVCDYFLNITCYCLEKNADFAQFRKDCGKLKVAMKYSLKNIVVELLMLACFK